MKTILIPTDFSESARNAALYAIKMFNAKEDRFILLNAYSIPPHHNAAMLIKLDPELKNEALDCLMETKKEICLQSDDQEVNLQLHAEAGPISTVVNYMVKNGSIDYIVMGTKGARGLKGVFFGSNTYQVIHEVACPVIAVPESASYTSPHKVVFATDLRRLADTVLLSPMIDLVTQWNAELYIVNVASPGEKEEVENSDSQMRLQKYFKSVGHTFHTIVNENAAEGIEEFVKSTACDLVVMLGREKGFFDNIFQRSVTRKVALHTSVPVLSLHEKQIL